MQTSTFVGTTQGLRATVATKATGKVHSLSWRFTALM